MTYTVGSFGPGWSWTSLRQAGAATVVGVGAAWAGLALLAPGTGLLGGGQSDPELRLTAAAMSIEHEAFTGGLGLVDNRTIDLARGETLTQAIRRAGASSDESRAVGAELAAFMDVERMAAGLPITVYFERAGADPRLTGVSFRSEPGVVVSVNLAFDGRFRARPIMMPQTFEIAHVAGTVETSLYEAATRAGATDREIQAIADVFAYDIDFQRDIFPGDRFEIVFERFRDDAGQTVRTAEALFVSLQTRSGLKSFYRFKAPGGEYDWYDTEGRTARKFLMKTPINGARLSSGFGMRRHPVLGFSRMHRGVDFAAPAGTPIMAAGDGQLEKIGWGGGLGRMVQIAHADGYKTIYGHMSGFARGLRQGQAVRQGQLIGYVGSTGMSTGPHLHYEVLYRNDHINPMAMRVPTGRNLEGESLVRFRAEQARINALRIGQGTAEAKPEGSLETAALRGSDGLRGAIE
jgi:murein DD-endopeptidase MepM/ murein hydrolase activator NlpD